MKFLKMLGLAAVAAAALMAFVGAGTASAVPVVCSTTVNPCPAAQQWPNNTLVDFSSVKVNGNGVEAGKAILEETSGFIKNECNSTVKGTLTNNTTGDPTLSGISLEWTNCSFTTKNITVGTLTIDTITGSSNGTVTVDTPFEVTTVVPSLEGNVSCEFPAPAGLSLGELKEGNPPIMHVNVILNKTPGNPAGCPSTARWTATYRLTSPTNTTGSLSHN